MPAWTQNKYIGAAAEGIWSAWNTLKGQVSPEAAPGAPAPSAPPVGAVAGISTGTLLLAGLAYMLLRGKR